MEQIDLIDFTGNDLIKLSNLNILEIEFKKGIEKISTRFEEGMSAYLVSAINGKYNEVEVQIDESCFRDKNKGYERKLYSNKKNQKVTFSNRSDYKKWKGYESLTFYRTEPIILFTIAFNKELLNEPYIKEDIDTFNWLKNLVDKNEKLKESFK